jgi:tetratricopeptide (TPR) repeat protein
LDQMTFDSDPALLGDVPTIPPHMTSDASGSDEAISDEAIEDILSEITPSSSSSDIAQSDAFELDELEGLEELPDDPDEFLKILEANVTDTVPDIDQAHDLNLTDSTNDLDSAIPDWLKIKPDSSDEALDWLEDSSSSGVFNWLDAEENVENQASASDLANHDTELAENKTSKPAKVSSIFDSDTVVSTQHASTPATEFQSMLAEGKDIPEVIRKIRAQLEVRNDSTLQKLLGDAYMEIGQLQDALDAYRQAQRWL